MGVVYLGICLKQRVSRFLLYMTAISSLQIFGKHRSLAASRLEYNFRVVFNVIKIESVPANRETLGSKEAKTCVSTSEVSFWNAN